MENNEEELEEFEEVVIEMTDEEGNKSYYCEEAILEVDGERFALLVPAHEHEEGEDCECEDDEAFFAKVITGDDGEDEYVEPTDEEFDKVMKAYEEMDDADSSDEN